MTEPIFLTAEWRWLAMLNYEVDPQLLQPLIPSGTELDLWEGRALISVVGFRFLKTRLGGWAIPGHQNFDEVNLRFYVRRRVVDGWRRGVVFVREIAPRRAVVWVARTIYNENYVYFPMRSQHSPPTPDVPVGRVTYEWRVNGSWRGVHGRMTGDAQPLTPGSEAEFITEHYWGYARQRDGSTMEYQVDHPPWKVWPEATLSLTGSMTDVYGQDFGRAIARPPASTLVAEGSAVVVRRGVKLRPE